MNAKRNRRLAANDRLLSSRMAGSEHSTSKTPGLAERPLSGKRDGRNGSMELPVVSPPERPSERRLGAEICRMACENYSGKADFPRCDICALGCDNDDPGADTIRLRQDHRNRVASRNAGCRMVAWLLRWRPLQGLVLSDGGYLRRQPLPQRSRAAIRDVAIALGFPSQSGLPCDAELPR